MRLSSNVITVGVLGCGYWGANLVRNLAESPEFRLVAAADPDSERRQRLASRYPGIRFVPESEVILSDPAIDAVAICTPERTHYAIARAALLSGKHVLVEKPLATSVIHAEELVRLARERRLTLMVDHTFIYTGALSKMRELTERGDLGDIYYFDSVRVNLGLFRHDVNVLWDLAPHDVSIMEYLLQDRPLAVSAVGQAHLNPRIVDVVYVNVHFDRSLLAHFHCNWLSPVKIRRIIIGGSKRLLLYDDMEPSEKLKVYDRGIDVHNAADIHNMLVQYRSGDMTAPKLDTREALAVACQHFAECIWTGREPRTGGAAGLSVVRLLEAAERSLATGSGQVVIDQARSNGTEDLLANKGSIAPSGVPLEAVLVGSPAEIVGNSHEGK